MILKESTSPWYSYVLNLKDVRSVEDVARIPDGTLVRFIPDELAEDVWIWARQNLRMEIVQAIHDASVHGWGNNYAIVFRQGYATGTPASYYAWVEKRRSKRPPEIDRTLTLNTSPTLLPKVEKDLYFAIAGFGAWICLYCQAGQHQSCEVSGGKQGDPCLCGQEEHNLEKAQQTAFRMGISKLVASQL